jgi:hypothetical protein
MANEGWTTSGTAARKMCAVPGCGLSKSCAEPKLHTGKWGGFPLGTSVAYGGCQQPALALMCACELSSTKITA